MKKIIFFTIFLLVSSVSFCQNWQWAKQIGGTQLDGGGVLIDINNNIYCSGYFENECYFQNDTLYSLGINDIFIAKYDASGNEIWSKRVGGNNPTNFEEYPSGFVIDKNNNFLYCSGQFYNSLTIDSHTITSSGQLDAFLAKFDLNGNCLWLIKAGSSLKDNSQTVSVDANGNVYWTCVLSGAGIVDTSNISNGLFLAKINGNGIILWIKQNFIKAGSPSWLAISNNEMIVSGVTRSDTCTIDTDTLISSNAIDPFLAKLDINGNIIWAKRFYGHTFDDFAGNFEIDANNDIILVGGFNDSIIIDIDTLVNAGKRDLFICKFDSNGNIIWARQTHANGNYITEAYFINKDSEGKFYIVGTFNGSANFGNFTITNSSLYQDMFITRYDTDGDCVGVRHFGEAQAYGVQVDNNDLPLVSGSFVNTVNIGITTLTSYGSLDMFFAKSGSITGIGGNDRIINNQLVIYANPNAGKCNITVPDDFLHEKNLTLSIYDNAGKLIQQKTLQMNDGKIKLNLEAEAKGVYNVSLSNGKKSYTGKIVFE